jgi:hypothetical protein
LQSLGNKQLDWFEATKVFRKKGKENQRESNVKEKKGVEETSTYV